MPAGLGGVSTTGIGANHAMLNAEKKNRAVVKNHLEKDRAEDFEENCGENRDCEKDRAEPESITGHRLLYSISRMDF